VSPSPAARTSRPPSTAITGRPGSARATHDTASASASRSTVNFMPTYWHAPLTFEGPAAGAVGGRRPGGIGCYARYLPKKSQIFCQPSIAASGR
jgi:hypothetical protein